jgi:hypothetical protein
MAGAEGLSATALSREVGLAQPTLSRWLREAARLAPMANHKHVSSDQPLRPRQQSPREWALADKLRAVLEAEGLSDAVLGAFLRERGLHEAQLRAWRSALQAALAESRPGQHRRTRSAETGQIRALQKELQRKDRALAEVTALLALKKRIAELWGDEADSTPTRNAT